VDAIDHAVPFQNVGGIVPDPFRTKAVKSLAELRGTWDEILPTENATRRRRSPADDFSH